MSKLGHVKPRNHLAGWGKLLQGKKDGWVINQKRIDLQQQPLSLKEQMLTLAFRYQGTLFPKDLLKWILTVASTKLYISRKNKMSQLKFSTEHVTWTEVQWNCVHFSNEPKFNWFRCCERRFVWCNPKKWYVP